MCDDTRVSARDCMRSLVPSHRADVRPGSSQQAPGQYLIWPYVVSSVGRQFDVSPDDELFLMLMNVLSFSNDGQAGRKMDANFRAVSVRNRSCTTSRSSERNARAVSLAFALVSRTS